jgi:hypothetical protein
MVPYSSIVTPKGFLMVPRPQQRAPWFERSQHGKHKTNKQPSLINTYLFNKQIKTV